MKQFLSKYQAEIKVFFLFVIWRATIFFIAYISEYAIPTFGNRFPYVETLKNYGLPHWVWAFGNFDGVHYLRLAKDGYVYQYTQAFFPFYPILIKLVSPIVFGNYLISALLISNVSFLFALIIFYRLIVKIYNSNIAFWSIIFLLTFPTSFYFGAVYTEGLFFLMIISSFYLALQNKNWQAATIGLFASATRIIGIFLSLSVFIKKRGKFRISFLLVPLGLISYMIYLQLKFNNALYFLTSQTAFGQSRETTKIILLPQVLYRWSNQLLNTHGLVFANSAFELTTTMVAFGLLLAGLKTTKKEWIIFGTFALITPTLTGSLASMPRYVLIAFPIYITLAQVNNNTVKIIIALIFTIALFISTIYFSQGYWVA